MPAPQTATAFVLQSYAPGAYVFGPNRVPNNYTQAVVSLTGQTVLPVGATVVEEVWLSYDNQASWVGPVAQANLPGGVIPAGWQQTIPFETATHYRVNLTVTGATVTIGASVTVS